MVEGRFEEAKENEEPIIREKYFLDESEEKEPYVPHKDSYASASDSDGKKGESKGGGALTQHKDKKKKKKKKRKEYKKALMSTFWKQVNLKGSSQTVDKSQMLPIEEYFFTGDLLPIFKREDASLVMRLMQTHFKAKDYQAYKDDNGKSIELLPRKPLMSADSQKFYERRYYLFSKYDQGIKLDEESIERILRIIGWYSVTPEEIAGYIAKRCKCGCILDAFCGAGGNSIQVYANDISHSKTDMALHNAKVYKVEETITLLNKDFLLLDKAKDFADFVDVVFVSPPWGGTSYSKDRTYNLEQIKPGFKEIVRKALSLADNVVLFLPRNVDLNQLGDILLGYDSLYPTTTNECIVTIEALIYGGTNIRAVLVFIGPLFKPKPQELFPKIKSFFKPAFETYQGIIVQNIIKAKSFTFCYEIAKRLQGKRVPPNAYIAKLKQALKEDEWNLLKKLHKIKPEGKCHSLPISPLIAPEEILSPECITEGIYND